MRAFHGKAFDLPSREEAPIRLRRSLKGIRTIALALRTSTIFLPRHALRRFKAGMG